MHPLTKLCLACWNCTGLRRELLVRRWKTSWINLMNRWVKCSFIWHFQKRVYFSLNRNWKRCWLQTKHISGHVSKNECHESLLCSYLAVFYLICKMKVKLLTWCCCCWVFFFFCKFCLLLGLTCALLSLLWEFWFCIVYSTPCYFTNWNSCFPLNTL